MRRGTRLSALDWASVSETERARTEEDRLTWEGSGTTLAGSDRGKSVCPVVQPPCPALPGMSRPALFGCFKTSPEVIRIAAVLYVRYPLSLRNVEDLLHERGIDITHETVGIWWGRFGQHCAAEIRRGWVDSMRAQRHRRWHHDEVFVKIDGRWHYLWRVVGHEGEVLESYVMKRRDKAATLKFLRKALRRHGETEAIVADRLASFDEALKAIGGLDKRETGRC